MTAKDTTFGPNYIRTPLQEVERYINNEIDKHPMSDWDDGFNAALRSVQRFVRRTIDNQET